MFLVGTPGSLKGLLKPRGGKPLKLDTVKALVLDEADEFLAQGGGLKADSLAIKEKCKNARIFLFSATFDQQMKQHIEKFIGREPRWSIALQGEEFHADNLLQYYFVTNDTDSKLKIVREIYENTSEAQTLLFCEKRETCDKVESVLKGELGFEVEKLHGALNPSERDIVLRKFRHAETHHLIATNVLARGIDIPTISLVINYDLPRTFKDNGPGGARKPIDVPTYIHRVGRCTRWKNRGMAISLISPSEKPDLEKIKARGNFDIKELKQEEIVQLEQILTDFRDATK